MQKEIIVSMIIIGGAAAAMGAGTFALFTDTGRANDNVFTSSTIDLHLNGEEDVEAIIQSTNFLPGQSVSGTVTLRNAGTAPDAEMDLDLAFDLSQTDALGGSTDIGKFLNVTAVTYGGESIASCFSDGNSNGFVDLLDLDTQTCVDKVSPGTGKDLALTVLFDTTAGNALQGDAATLTIRFLLAQKAAADIAA